MQVKLSLQFYPILVRVELLKICKVTNMYDKIITSPNKVLAGGADYLASNPDMFSKLLRENLPAAQRYLEAMEPAHVARIATNSPQFISNMIRLSAANVCKQDKPDSNEVKLTPNDDVVLNYLRENTQFLEQHRSQNKGAYNFLDKSEKYYFTLTGGAVDLAYTNNAKVSYPLVDGHISWNRPNCENLYLDKLPLDEVHNRIINFTKTLFNKLRGIENAPLKESCLDAGFTETKPSTSFSWTNSNNTPPNLYVQLFDLNKPALLTIAIECTSPAIMWHELCKSRTQKNLKKLIFQNLPNQEWEKVFFAILKKMEELPVDQINIYGNCTHITNSLRKIYNKGNNNNNGNKENIAETFANLASNVNAEQMAPPPPYAASNSAQDYEGRIRTLESLVSMQQGQIQQLLARTAFLESLIREEPKNSNDAENRNPTFGN